MYRAAQHLMLSQSALSRQVSALENELGTRLFELRGEKTFLTRAGERLYEYAMSLVQDIDRLPETFAEERMKKTARTPDRPLSARFRRSRHLPRSNTREHPERDLRGLSRASSRPTSESPERATSRWESAPRGKPGPAIARTTQRCRNEGEETGETG